MERIDYGERERGKRERARKRERGIMWTGKWELKSGLWWGKDTQKDTRTL